jgi:hypothetical protein
MFEGAIQTMHYNSNILSLICIIRPTLASGFQVFRCALRSFERLHQTVYQHTHIHTRLFGKFLMSVTVSITELGIERIRVQSKVPHVKRRRVSISSQFKELLVQSPEQTFVNHLYDYVRGNYCWFSGGVAFACCLFESSI